MVIDYCLMNLSWKKTMVYTGSSNLRGRSPVEQLVIHVRFKNQSCAFIIMGQAALSQEKEEDKLFAAPWTLFIL